MPPVQTRAGMVCIPATAHPDLVRLYLGPYRLLLADLAVVTMAENSGAVDAVVAAVHDVAPQLETVAAVFRPKPLEDVSGSKVFFCTTAPKAVAPVLRRHLTDEFGCVVVGISHALADRVALERELDESESHDVLVTEIKAGAVDVAVRQARRAGRRVVFADNDLIGDGVTGAFDRVLEKAFRGPIAG